MASLGRNDLAGWCDAPGALAVWHIGGRRARAQVAAKTAASAWRGRAKKKKERPAGSDARELGRSTCHLGPDAQAETAMALQCCACHPAHPALVAGGSYSGEVYVWNVAAAAGRGSADVAGAAREVARSRISPSSHHEPVVGVAWSPKRFDGLKGSRMEESAEHAFVLVSLGMDGKVLVWPWHKGGTMAAPIQSAALMHPQPKTHTRIVWGGTCLAVGGGEDAFVAGTEGGAVFRCRLDPASAATPTAAPGAPTRPLPSPIKSAFAPHVGPATSVAFSPFHRSLFMSCGSDATLRVFDLLNHKPLAELAPTPSPLFACAWSHHRPLVFATGTADGRVLFFDLAAAAWGADGTAGPRANGGGLAKAHPVRTVRAPAREAWGPVQGSATLAEAEEGEGEGSLAYAATGGKGDGPVFSVAFNPKQATCFASGCADGVVVWRIGPQLAESVPGEAQALETLRRRRAA